MINGGKLLSIARDAIDSHFKGIECAPGKFGEKRGAFVTLKINGKLRGCVGFVEPILDIYEAVSSAAESAAFYDNRFPPLAEKEFSKLDIEVSVLTKPKRIRGIGALEIGKHGIIAKKGSFCGVLLPQVALEHSMGRADFLDAALWKAGLESKEGVSLSVFEVEVFRSA